MRGAWGGDETQDLWCPSSAPATDRQSIFHSLTSSSSQVHPELEILLPFYRWGWRRQWQPTPVSCLKNPMDGGAQWAAVHGVEKSRTQLSDFTFTFHFGRGTYGFPVLRWERICLQCRRPRFDPWVGKIPWRREWQPTPVFLPGESQGRRSLVGCRLWGRTEPGTTEAT